MCIRSRKVQENKNFHVRKVGEIANTTNSKESAMRRLTCHIKCLLLWSESRIIFSFPGSTVTYLTNNFTENLIVSNIFLPRSSYYASNICGVPHARPYVRYKYGLNSFMPLCLNIEQNPKMTENWTEQDWQLAPFST